MAPRELYSSNLQWVSVTQIFTLRLTYFSALITVLSQCAGSAPVVLNNSRAHAPPKPGQTLSEIHKRLQAINKPAVKSIQSPDGDIIDCIHRDKQLALDHPLLRNHTIQEFPSSLADIQSSLMPNATLSYPFQSWHLTGISCPGGTIPVRRTTVEDLIRFGSAELDGEKSHGFRGQQPKFVKPATSNTHEYAAAKVQEEQYAGTGAILNVWNPTVESRAEFSTSEMWMAAGSYPDGDFNVIETGWQVYPLLYGDTNTRLFTFWLNNRHTSGCYNLQCEGFVQTSEKVSLGASFPRLYGVGNGLPGSSTYAGKQVEIRVGLLKDAGDRNWWLFVENEKVGYFPAQLFTHLADGTATMVEWGGVIVNNGKNRRHTTTEMGSGHFAGEGFQRASYIRNLHIVDSRYAIKSVGRAQIHVTNRDCYDVIPSHNEDWHLHIYFGGPGYNAACRL